MKLKYKLSILFLLIISLTTLTTLALVRRSTESMFRSFVFEGDAEKARSYATILAEYRLKQGAWDGIQAFIEELPDLFSRVIDAKIYGEDGWIPIAGYPTGSLRPLLADRVVVVDERGVIVADTANVILGTMHPSRHLEHGIPILVESERKGTVLVGSMIDSSLAGVDERFLDSVIRSLLWSTGVSAAIALVLGLIFAARITRPLGALASAAKNLASGGSSVPVPVAGRDELADLSGSFNEMTAEIRRLDAAKKQVIADSAHELRTPVTLIQGMVEGMIDGVFPRDIQTLESVHEETVRLSRLIDTLRELEIIESGELRLSFEGVDLRLAIRKASSLFAPAATAQAIRLVAEDDGQEAPVARGDSLRLGEVLYNLIANAIKYTPGGGTVRLRENLADDGFVSFSVDDSGPGIAPEERDRVFSRFYRIDKSRAAATGGRGLGLAIASEIVKAHGGSIIVSDSDLGGASFTVRLPRFSS